MKTLKFLTVILFASILLVGCNKSDDDGGDNPSAGSGSFTAQVDGSDFSGSIAANATLVNSNGVSVLTMLASNASGNAINIIINPFDGEGTYQISDSSVFTTASYIEADASNPSNSMTWVAPFESSGVVGEINISEQTETSVQGTFSFEARLQNGTDIVSVTNGEFNLDL